MQIVINKGKPKLFAFYKKNIFEVSLFMWPVKIVSKRIPANEIELFTILLTKATRTN